MLIAGQVEGEGRGCFGTGLSVLWTALLPHISVRLPSRFSRAPLDQSQLKLQSNQFCCTLIRSSSSARRVLGAGKRSWKVDTPTTAACWLVWPAWPGCQPRANVGGRRPVSRCSRKRRTNTLHGEANRVSKEKRKNRDPAKARQMPPIRSRGPARHPASSTFSVPLRRSLLRLHNAATNQHSNHPIHSSPHLTGDGLPGAPPAGPCSEFLGELGERGLSDPAEILSASSSMLESGLAIASRIV